MLCIGMGILPIVNPQHKEIDMATKGKLYVMTINFDNLKHKDLIEWLKIQAEENDRSVSSFCISIFKEYKKQKEASNGDK